MTNFFSSLDLSKKRGAVLRGRVEGISKSPLSGSGSSSASTSTSASTSASSLLKTTKKAAAAAAAVHQLSALQELLEQWDTKSKQEHHLAEDRYQVLELRDKILRIRKCVTFSMLIAKKISQFTNMVGDRGGAAVKVLCYKSEGRWFDSRWCHWNFSLT
jgi:hypothetical protein